MIKRTGPRITGGASDARLRAAAILDVLAGNRTPTQAAEAMSLSLQRYFALERRALEELVRACEPRPRGGGRRVHPEKEKFMLKKQIERLERECGRRQALIRGLQRAAALAAPPPKPAGRRKRRPTVRALKAAAVLRSEAPAPAETPASPPAT